MGSRHINVRENLWLRARRPWRRVSAISRGWEGGSTHIYMFMNDGCVNAALASIMPADAGIWGWYRVRSAGALRYVRSSSRRGSQLSRNLGRHRRRFCTARCVS